MIYRFRLVDGSVIETDGNGVADALRRAEAAWCLEHDRQRCTVDKPTKAKAVAEAMCIMREVEYAQDV